jgi:hypothetical protein
VYHFDTNDVGQWSEAQYNTLLYNNLHLHQLIGTVGALYRVAPGRSGDIHLMVRVLYEAGNAGVKRRARRHRDLTPRFSAYMWSHGPEDELEQEAIAA